MDLLQTLNDIERIARHAGRHIMRSYGTVTDIGKEISGKESIIAAYREASHAQEKSAFSRADEAAQIIIMEALAKKYAHCGIHGEESSEKIDQWKARFAHVHTLPDNAYTFIVDPIDGTRNFLNTNPANAGRGGDSSNRDYFAVGIHLAQGKRIVAGVFYFPALEVMLATAFRRGTFLNGHRVVLPALASPRFTDPVRVSQTVPELQPLFLRTIGYGSSCGNLLALLRGEITAYFTREIDLLDFGCSGLAYREAGGFVGDAWSHAVVESDLIAPTADAAGNPVILVRGFQAFTPTREYHERVMQMIAQAGVRVQHSSGR